MIYKAIKNIAQVLQKLQNPTRSPYYLIRFLKRKLTSWGDLGFLLAVIWMSAPSTSMCCSTLVMFFVSSMPRWWLPTKGICNSLIIVTIPVACYPLSRKRGIIVLLGLIKQIEKNSTYSTLRRDIFISRDLFNINYLTSYLLEVILKWLEEGKLMTLYLYLLTLPLVKEPFGVRTIRRLTFLMLKLNFIYKKRRGDNILYRKKSRSKWKKTKFY